MDNTDFPKDTPKFKLCRFGDHTNESRNFRTIVGVKEF